MACHEWNDAWVAQLYDELEPDERERLNAHLGGCASCRRTLEELEDSRELLRRHAPVVPASRGVLVLGGRAARRPAWSFAAGLAAAACLFGLGVVSAPQIQRLRGAAPSDPRPAQPTAPVLTQDDLDRSLAEYRRQVEARLAALATDSRAPAPTRSEPAAVTPELLAAELARFEKRLDHVRDQDRDYLLGEIAASEYRAGSYIDQTRNALRYVALAADRRVSEH